MIAKRFKHYEAEHATIYLDLKEEIRSQAYTFESQARQIQHLLVGKEELQAEVVTLKEELDKLKDSVQQHAVYC